MRCMERRELEQQILHLVRQALHQEVEPQTRLLDSGRLVDSMNIVKLVCEIEERYGVSFDDDVELDYLDDVKSLADSVWGKLND